MQHRYGGTHTSFHWSYSIEYYKQNGKTTDNRKAKQDHRSQLKELFQNNSAEMSDDAEYCCFVGGLSWFTSDKVLREEFDRFGGLIDAKVVVDRESGRSRGFGFVTFNDRQSMEDAIEKMRGIELDGRNITVEKAHLQGQDRDGSRDRDRGRDRDYGGGGRGSGLVVESA